MRPAMAGFSLPAIAGVTLADVQAISEVVAIFYADTSVLYTDAGSTNVTTDGDAVQEWHCANGSGLVMARNGASGITYQTAGGLEWVERTSNYLIETAPASLAPPMTFSAAVRRTGSGRAMFSFGEDTNTGTFNLLVIDTGAKAGLHVRDSASAVRSGLDSPSLDVDYIIYNTMAEGGAEDGYARVNQTEYAGAGDCWNDEGNDVITMFAEASSNKFGGSGRVYAAIATDGVPSDADRDTIEKWLAARAGVTL